MLRKLSHHQQNDYRARLVHWICDLSHQAARRLYSDFTDLLTRLHTIEDRWTIALCRVHFCLYAYKCAHQLFLSLYPLTVIGRLGHYDAFHEWIPRSIINAFAAGFSLMMALDERVLFHSSAGLKAYPLLGQVLLPIVDSKKKTVSSQDFFHLSDNDDGSDGGFRSHMDMLVDQRKRRHMVTVFYHLLYAPVEGFQGVTVAFLLMTHIRLGRKLYQHYAEVSSIHLVGHVINGLLFDWNMLRFAYQLKLLVCVSNTLVLMQRLRLRQISHRYLNVSTNRSSRSDNFDRFYQLHIETMVRFVRFNSDYGRMFVAFLLVNVPVSVWLLLLSLFGWLPLVTTLFALSLVAVQLLVNFGGHIFLARYSDDVHRPAKRLLRYAVLTSIVHIRERLRLDEAVALLHTAKRYGFRYGGFGLITLGNFSKFIMLYGKFLIITYKLIRSDRI